MASEARPQGIAARCALTPSTDTRDEAVLLYLGEEGGCASVLQIANEYGPADCLETRQAYSDAARRVIASGLAEWHGVRPRKVRLTVRGAEWVLLRSEAIRWGLTPGQAAIWRLTPCSYEHLLRRGPRIRHHWRTHLRELESLGKVEVLGAGSDKRVVRKK